MRKERRRLAERMREERELLQWIGPRSFRKKRLKPIKSTSKRVVIRRKVRAEARTISPYIFSSLPRLRHDDGRTARSHLEAGDAIYYREPDTIPGVCIKEYPDGRRELVYFDETGEIVVRQINPDPHGTWKKYPDS
jgi:hypothetical protein